MVRPSPVLVLALALLQGCPAADDDDSADPGPLVSFPAGDATESEPNDVIGQAQPLGVVGLEFAVTGSSRACGEGGTLERADVDWLSFSLDTSAPVRLHLDMMGGDLDLAVFDDGGELVAEASEPGVDDEVLALALDPGRIWTARIRCWMGNDGAIWRLRFL